MAFLAVPHSRVRAVQQLPASSSSQHPSSFGCSCFCSRCKTGERCLKLDPCFSASSPCFIFCLLSRGLTGLRCAQSCPAWQGIPLPGTEFPTSLPSRQTTAPSPERERGRQWVEEVDAGEPELGGPALSSKDTRGLLSGDQDSLLGVWQMRALTILSCPIIVWVRSRMAWSHHRGPGSIRTAIM